MNKNFTIVLILLGLVILGGVGYAIWNNSNTTQVIVQGPAQTTKPVSTVAPIAVQQAGSPIVKTDANTSPYISTVVVSGTVNPNGALTTYWYDYGTTASMGAETKMYLVGSGYAQFYTPAYITGLVSNTNYFFRLTAKNVFGTVSGSVYSFKTNTNPPPAEIAPIAGTKAATNVSRTSANLNGQINPNGSQTNFWFEYGPTSNLGSVTNFQSANSTSSPSAVSVAISNLTPVSKYYFRLNTQNQFGTVNGQILSFTTNGPLAPAAPTVNTISVSSINNNSAKLNARINPNGMGTTYWFEYSINNLLSNALVLTTAPKTLDTGTSSVSASSTIGGLNNNTKYYVRAVAQNQYGTIKGDIISFTTKK